MGTALGIYIENDLIKYSKIFSNKDKYYIDAYGVKYTTKQTETIKQIINETNSNNIPIIVNSIDQDYNYFDIFAKLNEKDYEKSIELQFEEITTESSINKNLLQTGYLITDNPEDKEKLHVMHISQYLTAMDTRANLFTDNKPVSQMPMGVSIANITKDISSVIILNLEGKTELTALHNKNVYEVKSLHNSIGEIIKQINVVENSMSKSYEVLKNTIVPISESDNLNMDENEHIPLILAELNDIIGDIKQYLKSTPLNISKLYLTGTGATISNIELLFSESLPGLEVEILKPFFLDATSLNLSVKEYVDVNSASALALEELGFRKPNMTFKTNGSKKANINLNMDLKDIDFSQIGNNIKESFAIQIQPFESFAIRFALTSFIILIIFLGMSNMLTNTNNEKILEAEQNYSAAVEVNSRVEKDISDVKNKTEEYKALLNKMDEGSNAIGTSSTHIRKDALPNFLNQVAHLIPVRVKVTGIKEEKSHIKLSLESAQYEQLGYFVGLLENEGVLMKIKTSTSQKEGNVVTLVVEGDLP